MSRLTSFSPAALRAMFSPEAEDTFIILLTLTSSTLPQPIRLADNYTMRLSETEADILYGVKSRLNDYIFLPMEIVLPDEQNGSSPRAAITLRDVTRIVLPQVRQLVSPPEALLEIVMKSTPDIVEASFSGLKLTSISYNADAITGELSMEDLALEPFPQHTFSPAYFPAAF